MAKFYSKGNFFFFLEVLKMVIFMQSSKTKGALNGKQKRSIFAVPDSLSGRVCIDYYIL